MSASPISNFIACLVFADAFPAGRSRTPALEVLAPTGPAGIAQVAKDLVAFQIIDSYLDAAAARIANQGPYHIYRPAFHNGQQVLERVLINEMVGGLFQAMA